MASSLDVIEFICKQIATAGEVKYRKMFGDYMIYVNDKPVVIVGDDIPYVKMHEIIGELMSAAEQGYPYEAGQTALYFGRVETRLRSKSSEQAGRSAALP